jgi:hypothetical protein
MSRSRFWLVNGLIAFIGAGHLYDIATGKEHWPFSEYPMFARLRVLRKHGQFRLVGVTDEAASREVVLRHRQYGPFDPPRFARAMRQLRSRAARRQKSNEVLAYVLDQNELLRRSGRHRGPPLRGIRLYRVSWKVDPLLRNVDRPDERHLLAKFMRPVEARP